MSPRQRFFECLHRSPPALFEAALWMAAEHEGRERTAEEINIIGRIRWFAREI